MADNKNNILRYVTGDMEEDEAVIFESEMAGNGELRLRVQLEQVRMANIQGRVARALPDDGILPLTGLSIAETTQPSELSRFLKKIKRTNWRQWLSIAAVSTGMAVGISWLCQRESAASASPVATVNAHPENPAIDKKELKSAIINADPGGGDYEERLRQMKKPGELIG